MVQFYALSKGFCSRCFYLYNFATITQNCFVKIVSFDFVSETLELHFVNFGMF
jgi:hypothetical protein